MFKTSDLQEHLGYADFVLENMLDGHVYSSVELATITKLSHRAVCKILLYLDMNKLIHVLKRGVLPRRLRYTRRHISLTPELCSPDILPFESTAYPPAPIKSLRSVK